MRNDMDVRIVPQDFKIDASKVEQVYSGKGNNACRCGCKGTYSRDAKTISRIVNKLNRAIAAGETATETFGYIYDYQPKNSDHTWTVYYRQN